MIFDAVRIFDGSAFIECGTVAVDGTRIAAVDAVDGAPTQTLLPGFIDCHVHLGFFDARDVLRGGVTTARDLGWPLEVPLDGGPDVVRAGQILTAAGGYPSRAAWARRGTAREVRDASDAVAAVREQVAAGAHVIKIAQEPRSGPTLSLEIVEAIVAEARTHGLYVTSHCGALAQLDLALDAGVTEFAHGLWSDERISDDTLARMVGSDVTVVPTLHIEPSDARVDNLRRFIARGGRVVYGTDMGNPPVPPGIDTEEVMLMRMAGLSLEETFAAATSRAAAHLGLGDRGRIEAGARADLVLVDGDPREDLRALSRVAGVWKAGARA